MQQLIEAVKAAGLKALSYQGKVRSEDKADGSPVTLADRAAHQILMAALEARDYPVLSEEGAHTPWAVRRHWGRYWLVDPLDGTKEFLAGRDEFTVNVALIDKGRPVLGLVYVPATDHLYVGEQGKGAYVEVAGQRRAIAVREATPPVVLASRSHPVPELVPWLAALGEHQLANRGSSLKFCAIAEGQAQLYPRFNPTMMWDTAAGQAVLEAAGGQVLTLDGEPLSYHREALRNPAFIASAGALPLP
ncbi:3'(2'),5'-bisphosphate nucleotidase CysQ [Gallaecimonas kandeliae]|uniref:3'(2'),5'-bisphosphate nucleotidase CysQ n=1 Tax=Gallaecimonas kandeliae TaxID=3029055 RepID=UPI002648C2E9|nr:3'(2'),5'-bisphosphate nucleotidase CysQ [Gallaecimonas kandeliae]WKE66277.1 3'(2'),5'-bisphosphate nucleotidase CysQ [Gallaecimonas kandeliae]